MKSEKCNVKPRLECINGRHPPSKLRWMYCLGHAGMKGKDRADRTPPQLHTISLLHCLVLQATTTRRLASHHSHMFKFFTITLTCILTTRSCYFVLLAMCVVAPVSRKERKMKKVKMPTKFTCAFSLFSSVSLGNIALRHDCAA